MTSLDQRYHFEDPALFVIEVQGDSQDLGLRKRDKLIINRAMRPEEGQLVLMVISNRFSLRRFSQAFIHQQDPEKGDFVWGVVTTLLRQFKEGENG